MFKTEPSELSKIIKPLDDQQSEADANYPIPYKLSSFVWALAGTRGSGKSSLLINVLDSKLRNKFQNIFYCSQTYRNDIQSKAPMAELIEELQEEDKVYDTFNDEIAEQIIKKIEDDNEAWRNADKKKRGKAPQHCLIVDDCLTDLSRSNMMNSPSHKLFVNGRHLKCSVILSLQKYVAIPLLWRQQLSCLTIFGNSNKRDVDAILNDIVIDPDLFKAMYAFATNEPHSFLHANFLTHPTTWYKRFDKIIPL